LLILQKNQQNEFVYLLLNVQNIFLGGGSSKIIPESRGFPRIFPEPRISPKIVQKSRGALKIISKYSPKIFPEPLGSLMINQEARTKRLLGFFPQSRAAEPKVSPKFIQ
jgi:hypothetical protein